MTSIRSPFLVGIPLQPNDIKFRSSTNVLTISWTPRPNGRAILYNEVNITNIGVNDTTPALFNLPGNASSVTITGIKVGFDYHFSLASANSVGSMPKLFFQRMDVFKFAFFSPKVNFFGRAHYSSPQLLLE
jgi:hypothetical protein